VGVAPHTIGMNKIEYISVTDQADARASRLVKVDEGQEGQRLDNFLAQRLKGVPKSHLYKMIRSGEVRINGGRCAADSRIKLGDQVRIPPVRLGLRPLCAVSAPAIDLSVLWEDEDLLAIDKPTGLAVHGGSGVAHGVIERLRASRPSAKFLELVHRLDRGTSGVLLIAKRRSALVHLHAQLRAGLTDKRYRVIVIGRWPLRSKRINWPLLRTLTATGERMVYVRSDGQSASTILTGLQHVELPALGVVSLVEAKLETGRTHQIRVHCAHAGFPIVGDDRYGDFALNAQAAALGWRRMYLHAWSLQFAHPRNNEILRVEAPQPEGFDRLIAHASSF